MSKFSLFGGKEKRNATEWLTLGQAAFQQGQYQAALESLDEALRIDPGLAQAWYFKAGSLDKLNHRQEEIRAWVEYLKLKPDDVNAWAAKANAHFQLQTPVGQAEAIRCVERGLQLDPNNMQLKLLKRLFQGDRSVLTELGLEQEMVEHCNNKAKLSLEVGKPEEALGYAEEALRFDAQSVKALNNAAVALLQLGRLQEALSSLEQAIALDPSIETLWYNKAGVLEQLNRLVEALQAYEKVLELNPQLEKAWKNKALLLNRLGRDEEALRCFDTLIELNPNDDDAWYNKGILLANLGQPDFMACFLRALRINPQHEGVRQLFKDLEQAH